MPLVHLVLKTPTRATLIRLRNKRARQEGKLLIDEELKTLEKNPDLVPVRESHDS